MKILSACAAAAVLGSAVNMASAALLVADGFNYPTPGVLAGNADTDYASNPATWALTGTAGSDPTVIAGSLTYSGTGAPPNLPGGNSAQINTTGAGTPRIQLATPASNGVFSQAANGGTSLYYSFTMQATNITALSTGAIGSFFAGFNNSTGTQAGALSAVAGVLCMRKDTSTSTTFHLGVAQNQAPTTDRIFDNTDSYGINDPLFIVVAYNFGTVANSDTADLYVFDSATSTAIPDAQPGTATVHSPYGAEINASVDNLESFFLRDNTGAANISIDDLRIGTTWGDITATPEPASLGLLGIGALGLMGRRRKAR